MSLLFKAKPVWVEAVQVLAVNMDAQGTLTGQPFSSMPLWITAAINRKVLVPVKEFEPIAWSVETPTKILTANANDWLIQGKGDELFVLGPQVFIENYESIPLNQ